MSTEQWAERIAAELRIIALDHGHAPRDIDSVFEHCLNLRRLADVAPERADGAADRIIEDLSPLDVEERLPPSAADTLAWARETVAGRRAGP
ncbi:hypothetical protein ACQP1W_30620 [Spirillospora sp. CA-255316]